MMEIRTALKCFNQRKCRFLTPCFYVRKRPVSISVKRGFYARKIPARALKCCCCDVGEVAEILQKKTQNIRCQ